MLSIGSSGWQLTISLSVLPVCSEPCGSLEEMNFTTTEHLLAKKTQNTSPYKAGFDFISLLPCKCAAWRALRLYWSFSAVQCQAWL